MSRGDHRIRYASAEALVNDWIFGKIQTTACCTENGESLVSHGDVIICGDTSRLLAARNREIERVFALTAARILGGRTIRHAVEMVAASHRTRTDGDAFPFPVVRINSFERWNPLKCTRRIARERMMETFRFEADSLLDEWESLSPDDQWELNLKESAWEALTGMLACLDECVPSQYEERHMALLVKLRLLGWSRLPGIDFQF